MLGILKYYSETSPASSRFSASASPKDVWFVVSSSTCALIVTLADFVEQTVQGICCAITTLTILTNNFY